MLRTQPNTGTYYPPKVMLDGEWKYLISVTEWRDHEHDAQEAHRLEAKLKTITDVDLPAANKCRERVEELEGVIVKAYDLTPVAFRLPAVVDVPQGALLATLLNWNIATQRFYEIQARVAELESGAAILDSNLRNCQSVGDSLRARVEEMETSLQGIADADWRKWDSGMNSPEDFVAWAQSRARHTLEHESQPETVAELGMAVVLGRRKMREAMAAELHAWRYRFPDLEFSNRVDGIQPKR